MYVTLDELLLSREERVLIQKEMQNANSAPLISFTMNIPGPEKTSPLIERAFDLGVRLILDEIKEFELLSQREKRTKCGPVAFFSVRADARVLKRRLTLIEDTHPIGRIFDMDVIDSNGTHLNREKERCCMICSAPGRACAAGRLHSVTELVEKTGEILNGYFLPFDAHRIASLAKQSLLQEVYTTPKPGLVDNQNSGSHSDMSLSDFVSSAEALEPYFFECVISGVASRGDAGHLLFQNLRSLGISAEKSMYAATDGKNTHKGVIFSFGIVLGAIGRLLSPCGELPPIAMILSEAANISRQYLNVDFETLVGKTAGERAYMETGARGIRGEVMEGFPSVLEISIPAYKKAVFDGKNKNDAGVITLLHLIARVYDTCLYKRGGVFGVEYAQKRAQALIASGTPTLEQIRKMDSDFTERNLSPGGCADLLALTCFLCDLENEYCTENKI